MQEKQKKAIRWISPVLIALTALIVWRVNYEIEFMMDDEWYSTVLYADTPIRISATLSVRRSGIILTGAAEAWRMHCCS